MLNISLFAQILYFWSFKNTILPHHWRHHYAPFNRPFSSVGVSCNLIPRARTCTGDSRLKKTYNYHTQVQGQLGICSSSNFCDFVVRTQKGLYVERIYKNLSFVEQLVKKLTTFHVECLLPEIMTHNILDAECSKNPQN